MKGIIKIAAWCVSPFVWFSVWRDERKHEAHMREYFDMVNDPKRCINRKYGETDEELRNRLAEIIRAKGADNA